MIGMAPWSSGEGGSQIALAGALQLLVATLEGFGSREFVIKAGRVRAVETSGHGKNCSSAHQQEEDHMNSEDIWIFV
jgi:hypothetical protein